MQTAALVATPENFIQIMDGLNAYDALNYAQSIQRRLEDLNIDGDRGYWMEKPWKFPEYWVPALNGTLDEDDLESAE